jgi:hypothetical protein
MCKKYITMKNNFTTRNCNLNSILVIDNHLKNKGKCKKIAFLAMKTFAVLSLAFVFAGCRGNDPKPEPEKPTENSTFTVPKNVVAVVVNNGIQVSWDKVSGTYKGSSVFDALGYVVEHSGDGNTFTSCGNIDATQTSFIDINPLNGNNYYRIKAKYDANVNLYTDYSQSVMCTYKITAGTLFVNYPRSTACHLEIEIYPIENDTIQFENEPIYTKDSVGVNLTFKVDLNEGNYFLITNVLSWQLSDTYYYDDCEFQIKPQQTDTLIMTAKNRVLM